MKKEPHQRIRLHRATGHFPATVTVCYGTQYTLGRFPGQRLSQDLD